MYKYTRIILRTRPFQGQNYLLSLPRLYGVPIIEAFQTFVKYFVYNNSVHMFVVTTFRRKYYNKLKSKKIKKILKLFTFCFCRLFEVLLWTGTKTEFVQGEEQRRNRSRPRSARTFQVVHGARAHINNNHVAVDSSPVQIHFAGPRPCSFIFLDVREKENIWRFSRNQLKAVC